MQAYVELGDDEVRAIFAYLRTVPPIHNKVARTPSIVAVATASDGAAVYHKYACQSCHGETGIGLCDLRKAHKKYASDADIIAFVKDPSLTVPGSKMPSWGGVIDEAEYPALVAYVRKLGGAAP